MSSHEKIDSDLIPQPAQSPDPAGAGLKLGFLSVTTFVSVLLTAATILWIDAGVKWFQQMQAEGKNYQRVYPDLANAQKQAEAVLAGTPYTSATRPDAPPATRPTPTLNINDAMDAYLRLRSNKPAGVPEW